MGTQGDISFHQSLFCNLTKSRAKFIKFCSPPGPGDIPADGYDGTWQSQNQEVRNTCPCSFLKITHPAAQMLALLPLGQANRALRRQKIHCYLETEFPTGEEL